MPGIEIMHTKKKKTISKLAGPQSAHTLTPAGLCGSCYFTAIIRVFGDCPAFDMARRVRVFGLLYKAF